MTAAAHVDRDPLLLLAELAKQPNVTRNALELAIRTGKLTAIERHGKVWVIRSDADAWLSWRASTSGQTAPLYQFEL